MKKLDIYVCFYYLLVGRIAFVLRQFFFFFSFLIMEKGLSACTEKSGKINCNTLLNDGV